MIVKVQLSLFTTAAARQVMIYNRDRSIEFQMDATDGVIEKMDGRPKAFFFAALCKDGSIDLLDEAPFQNW